MRSRLRSNDVRCFAGVVGQEAQRARSEEDQILAQADAGACAGMYVLSEGIEEAQEVGVYCLMCHRLLDYRPCGFCLDCEKEINVNNERVYHLSLLKYVYKDTRSIWIRQKIEKVLEM